jgi:hypothetical protein
LWLKLWGGLGKRDTIKNSYLEGGLGTGSSLYGTGFIANGTFKYSILPFFELPSIVVKQK